MKFIHKYLFLLIYISSIPTLFAQNQKEVMLIVPKAQAIKEGLYKDVNNGLVSGDDFIIKELNSPETWKDILDNLEKTDSASLKDRMDYFQNSGIIYYIEVMQVPIKGGSGKFKNIVNLYSDTNTFKIDWISKIDDHYYLGLLRFNLEKIRYCIKNNIEKKDIVLINTTNNIRTDSLRNKFMEFGLYFSRAVELNPEINSKYSFNKILNIVSEETKADYIDYDIKLQITLSEEVGFIRVKIIMKDIYEDTALPIFNNKYSSGQKIEIFCSIVATKFIELNKTWLLKDH